MRRVVACGLLALAADATRGVIDLGAVGALITVVWIAGLTNAWNFMMDHGIAAAQAIIGAWPGTRLVASPGPSTRQCSG